MKKGRSEVLNLKKGKITISIYVKKKKGQDKLIKKAGPNRFLWWRGGLG